MPVEDSEGKAIEQYARIDPDIKDSDDRKLPTLNPCSFQFIFHGVLQK